VVIRPLVSLGLGESWLPLSATARRSSAGSPALLSAFLKQMDSPQAGQEELEPLQRIADDPMVDEKVREPARNTRAK
jgi:hypothetical protein